MERYIFLKTKAFYKWVNQMYHNFCQDDRYIEMIDAYNSDTSRKYTYIRNVNNGKVFFSKCNNSDNYDNQIGIAVAYARAKSHKIAIRVKKKIIDPNMIELGQTLVIKFMFKNDIETVVLENEDKLNAVKWRFDLFEYCYLLDK